MALEDGEREIIEKLRKMMGVNLKMYQWFLQTMDISFEGGMKK